MPLFCCTPGNVSDRTLQRLRIPVLIFVNKIDRAARTATGCWRASPAG
ncbi:MAG: hypothetical protein ACLPN6_10150 [Streptosporangiaceae bacterium]|jgi:translation initiation factor IF-2